MDPSDIEEAAVIGGGLMGAGIAQILAQAGCHVHVVDLTDRLLEGCLQRVREGLVLFVESGVLADSEVGAIVGRIEGTTSLPTAVRDAQFVVEAVVEQLDVKQRVFEDLDRWAPLEAILATNTSGLSVGEIAQLTRHPERVVGSHFFYPPLVVPLVEVGYGSSTSDATVERTVAFWKRCGREPVVCRKDRKGFIANRLQAALVREAMSLVAGGVASAQDVDRALRFGLGLRMALVGILEQRDWGSLRSTAVAYASIYPTLEDSKVPLPFLTDRIARGETGAAAGKGIYDWTGRDVGALRRKKQRQLIELTQAIKRIMPEEEELVENP